MKCLAEPIAKRGNREEKVTGHFWEGRFKAQPLLDEMAIAACMAYVDLNPIRAGLAKTPEKSNFTSVKERIDDLRAANEAWSGDISEPAKAREPAKTPSSGLTARVGHGRADAEKIVSPCQGEKGQGEEDARDMRVEHGEKAGWLAPIALEPPRRNVREKATTRRTGNKGCLPMTLSEYLRLLDWTGRQLRRDKIGRIPAEFAPLLDRLECSGESWLDLVKNFRRRFRTEAGLARSVASIRTLRQTRSMTMIPTVT
jgi:hypothetical protein